MKSMIRALSATVLALGLVGVSVAPGEAAPILIGTTIHVELLDNGVVGDPLPEDILVVGGQREITWDNTPFVTNIGSSGAMLDGEFIDAEALSLTFNLFGGGDEIQDALPDVHRFTGFGPGARYVFSNLFSPDYAIASVAITLTDVIGVALGSEVFFTDNSVTLFIDTLGILESASNLGSIRLDFQVRQVQGDPVPEPATLALVGTGALAFLRRRQRSRL